MSSPCSTPRSIQRLPAGLTDQAAVRRPSLHSAGDNMSGEHLQVVHGDITRMFVYSV
ncbi:hypothetical protein CBM2637_A150045 [Cupriavidus taiwanensis]|nr:hypothetical protein CBM2637_A150045 [Cupriavidus taiwanensis]